jgi:hypothetical protein
LLAQVTRNSLIDHWGGGVMMRRTLCRIVFCKLELYALADLGDHVRFCWTNVRRMGEADRFQALI